MRNYLATANLLGQVRSEMLRESSARRWKLLQHRRRAPPNPETATCETENSAIEFLGMLPD